MEQYHIMGSRILSRSFNVERPDPGDANDEGEEGDGAADMSCGSGMDVDEEPPGSVQNGDEETRHGDDDADGEEEEVDGEDEVEVCMLPMADMLNARYGLENVSSPSIFSASTGILTIIEFGPRQSYSTKNTPSK